MESLLRMRIVVLILGALLACLAAIMAVVRIDEKVSCTGIIEPAELDTVRARDARIIETIEVQEGDQVETGQLLAKLDTHTVEEELAKQEERIRILLSQKDVALAALKQAQAVAFEEQLELARLEVKRAEERSKMTADETERTRQLLEKEFASSREVEDAEAAQRLAALDLESARQRLKIVEQNPERSKIDQARKQLAYVETQVQTALEEKQRLLAQLRESVVKAPRKGRLIAIFVDEGEQPSPGTELFAIDAGSGLAARARILEHSLGSLAVGQRARVSTPAFPHRLYGYARGELTFISESAHRASDSAYFDGVVRIDESPFPLKPGSTVTVEIITGRMSPLEIILGRKRRE